MVPRAGSELVRGTVVVGGEPVAVVEGIPGSALGADIERWFLVVTEVVP